MKVSYYSLGCKVNLYESEAVINQFIDNGFELGNFHDVCDVYIINTCSITEVSDSKSRKMIRQAIKKNNEAVVAVMGCYAQLKPEDIKAIEGVDVLVGTNNRHLLFPLVMENLESKKKITLIDDIMKVKEYEEVKINRYNNKTRGFVKIQDGCNNFCSYCTIPYARGLVRSRNKNEVIDEIKLLVKNVKKIDAALRMREMEMGLPPGTYSSSKMKMPKGKKGETWEASFSEFKGGTNRTELKKGIDDLQQRLANLETIMNNRREKPEGMHDKEWKE